MGGDLMWLWSLLGVIALFVLGWLAYRMRHPDVPDKDQGSGAPDIRRVRRRDGSE